MGDKTKAIRALNEQFRKTQTQSRLVRPIRALCRPGVNDLQEIANQFGITKAALGHIKYGITWKWLT
jgi:hypothetical protein